MAYITGVQGFGIPTNTQSAATLVNDTTIFTITGGPIHILQLVSYCITPNDGTAATLKWTADGDAAGQTATDITGVSASLASFAAGGAIFCPFTILSTAPTITGTTGVMQAAINGVIIPAGILKTVIGSGPTTGTWQHFMRWQPMYDACTVTAAF